MIAKMNVDGRIIGQRLLIEVRNGEQQQFHHGEQATTIPTRLNK